MTDNEKTQRMSELIKDLALSKEIEDSSSIYNGKLTRFVESLQGSPLLKSDPYDLPPIDTIGACLLYTSPSPRDKRQSRMPSSA